MKDPTTLSGRHPPASWHPLHSLKKDTGIEKKSALIRHYSEALQKRRMRKDSLVV